MSRHHATPSRARRLNWATSPEGTRAALWLVLACNFLDRIPQVIVTPSLVNITITLAQATLLLLLTLQPSRKHQESTE